MAAQCIATTRSADLQAVSGQAVLESWSALHASFTRELSPAHAALLAEPVLNPAQGTVDWYADGNAAARRLIDLPADERAALETRITELAGGIETLAQTLSVRRTETDRLLSVAMLGSLRTPGPEYVYAVGSQPVLVAWSHAKTGERAAEAWLVGQARVAAAPVPAPSVPRPQASPVSPAGVQSILPPPSSPYRRAAMAPRASWRAMMWSCLSAAVVMALASAAVLRDPFGWFEVPVPQCQLDPGQLPLEQGLQEAVAQGSVLRAELARLSADAGRRRLMCPPVPAATPAPPPPQPPPSNDARRAEQQGARTGKLQVILAWDDTNDLDLQVVCPAGDGTINFNRRRACGGTLDVDANGDVNHLTSSPVENVFFDDPAPGTYQVVVDAYGMREHGSAPFRITIHRDGRPDEVVNGVAQNGQRYRRVTSFTVPAP